MIEAQPFRFRLAFPFLVLVFTNALRVLLFSPAVFSISSVKLRNQPGCTATLRGFKLLAPIFSFFQQQHYSKKGTEQVSTSTPKKANSRKVMATNWTLTFAYNGPPPGVVTLNPSDGVSGSTTVAQVKGLLRQHCSLPEWMTSLSYNGQSLDGQGRKTLDEVGIAAGSQLQLMVFAPDAIACTEHPDCVIELFCVDCLQFLCVRCLFKHTQRTSHQNILSIGTPAGASNWSDEQQEAFYGLLKPSFEQKQTKRAQKRRSKIQERLTQIEEQLQGLQEEQRLLREEEAALNKAIELQQHWKTESLPYLVEQ